MFPSVSFRKNLEDFTVLVIKTAVVGFYININEIRFQMSKNQFPKNNIFHIKSLNYYTEMLNNVYLYDI